MFPKGLRTPGRKDVAKQALPEVAPFLVNLDVLAAFLCAQRSKRHDIS